MASAIQKACHTPTAPNALLSRNAAGTITRRYLIKEIIKDRVPCPSPSSSPLAVTDMDETRNPMLIIRREVHPAEMVSRLDVNSPISQDAKIIQMMVPASITPAVRASAV